MTSTEKATEARRFLVRGRVQGVGFRWFVEREAHILGIAGWVRNNHDGSVEVLAQGTRDQFVALRSRLREGPRAARVDTSKNPTPSRSPDSIHFALKERGRCRQSPIPAMNADQLKKLIREVPDFPKPGILFYDITTLLKDKTGFATLIDKLVGALHCARKSIWCWAWRLAALFLRPALAYRLNAGFVPVRKPGKLPAETVKYDYALEYGTNSLEIHKDAIQKGQRVLIVDDLLATGGTAEATAKTGGIVGRRDRRPGICRGTGIPEGPRQAEEVRRDVAAALRQVVSG